MASDKEWESITFRCFKRALSQGIAWEYQHKTQANIKSINCLRHGGLRDLGRVVTDALWRFNRLVFQLLKPHQYKRVLR